MVNNDNIASVLFNFLSLNLPQPGQDIAFYAGFIAKTSQRVKRTTANLFYIAMLGNDVRLLSISTEFME